MSIHSPIAGLLAEGGVERRAAASSQVGNLGPQAPPCHNLGPGGQHDEHERPRPDGVHVCGHEQSDHNVFDDDRSVLLARLTACARFGQPVGARATYQAVGGTPRVYGLRRAAYRVRYSGQPPSLSTPW